jgi:virginiamycin B lyase
MSGMKTISKRINNRPADGVLKLQRFVESSDSSNFDLVWLRKRSSSVSLFASIATSYWQPVRCVRYYMYLKTKEIFVQPKPGSTHALAYGRLLSMCCRRAGVLFWLVLGLAASAAAQSGTYSDITQFSVAASGHPFAMTAGPDGALWLTEAFAGNNKIGRITTSGAFTEYSVPGDSSPNDITAGPDGALWFTDDGNNSINRITTAGVVTEYSLPTILSNPGGITTGPDGALWFTELGSNISAPKIGRITTAGTITEYPVPNGDPVEITTGPDGALWFTNFLTGKIGRITTHGAITEYLVSDGVELGGITAGLDGALWFTEVVANKIGRITTAGLITEYPIPGGGVDLYWIKRGADGALWFMEGPPARIARITTTGVITQYLLPNTSATPEGIASGPDGALWFTEFAYTIGRAPACGLGLGASFANNTITLNFDLGIDTPAIWDLKVGDALTTKPIPAVVPPRAFSIDGGPVAYRGLVSIKSSLSNSSKEVLCAEWTTVNTAP